MTITDMAGRSLTISKEDTERVVCIGAGALRLYSYVGDTDKLCGVEGIEKKDNTFNGILRPYREINREKFRNLPTCGAGGPNAQHAETEAIAGCSPTIVISEYSDVKSMDDLQDKLGVPVVILSYGTALGTDPKISDSLTLLGRIFHKEARAKELTDYIASMQNDLLNRTRDIKDEDKKSVYLGCLGNWGVQDIYSTAAGFSLMNLSHINNAADKLKDVDPNKDGITYTSVDLESLATTINPDKIILDAAGIKKFKTTYFSYTPEQKEIFNSITAVKNHEIYYQMPFNAYFTNIETAYMDAYYEGMVAFPEAFSDITIAEKSDEITEKFLGVKYYDTYKSFHNGGFKQITDLDTFLNEI